MTPSLTIPCRPSLEERLLYHVCHRFFLFSLMLQLQTVCWLKISGVSDQTFFLDNHFFITFSSLLLYFPSSSSFFSVIFLCSLFPSSVPLFPSFLFFLQVSDFHHNRDQYFDLNQAKNFSSEFNPSSLSTFLCMQCIEIVLFQL